MGSVGRFDTLGKDEVDGVEAAAVGIGGSTGVLTITNTQPTRIIDGYDFKRVCRTDGTHTTFSGEGS